MSEKQNQNDLTINEFETAIHSFLDKLETEHRLESELSINLNDLNNESNKTRQSVSGGHFLVIILIVTKHNGHGTETGRPRNKNAIFA